jgi:hypothetical protein
MLHSPEAGDTAAPGGIMFGRPAPLDEVHAYLARFVVYPDAASSVAHTLWVAHTHAMNAWESTPRLAFLSPELGSGKSRALEATTNLVPRPVQAVNVTASYLFRKVGGDDGRPTILFDEIDTVFGPKARENEDLRGLLNAGHRRDGVAGRCAICRAPSPAERSSSACAGARPTSTSRPIGSAFIRQRGRR